MVKDTVKNTHHQDQTSKLSRLSLGFEYNKTIRDIKKEVRERTY